MQDSAAADNICSEIKKKRTTGEWGIADNVQAAVADNGASMDAAGWADYPCFAHTTLRLSEDDWSLVSLFICFVNTAERNCLSFVSALLEMKCEERGETKFRCKDTPPADVITVRAD